MFIYKMVYLKRINQTGRLSATQGDRLFFNRTSGFSFEEDPGSFAKSLLDISTFG